MSMGLFLASFTWAFLLRFMNIYNIVNKYLLRIPSYPFVPLHLLTTTLHRYSSPLLDQKIHFAYTYLGLKFRHLCQPRRTHTVNYLPHISQILLLLVHLVYHCSILLQTCKPLCDVYLGLLILCRFHQNPIVQLIHHP